MSKETEDTKYTVFKGTYGCVYYPSVPCLSQPELTKKDRDKYITKIASQTELIKEINISKYLSGYPDYFLVAEREQCRVLDLSKKNKDKCNITQTDPQTMYMMYGGVELHRYAIKCNIKQLESLFVHACMGLIKMHSLGICHFDIKPSNIAVTQDGILRYFDYGLSYPDGLIHTGFETFYYYWSPEFMLLNFRIA